MIARLPCRRLDTVTNVTTTPAKQAAALAAVERAHRQLVEALDGVQEAHVGQPSRLPGWTVGHVLTHIARNADGIGRMLSAAADGKIGEMYPGGKDRRHADIETGAVRSLSELREDVAASATALEERFQRLPTTAWSGAGRMIAGEMPISSLPFLRRREVLVHHVDLGLGFEAEQWPIDYVRDELTKLGQLWASRRPMGLTTLPEALLAESEHRRVLWLMGRIDVPGLERCSIL
jgi:maleylpyruvate isomerase